MKNAERNRGLLVLVVLLGLNACMHQEYKAIPFTQDSASAEIETWTLDNPELLTFYRNVGLAEQYSANSPLSFQQLYIISLFYSPELRIAYQNWQKAKAAIPQKDSRVNPTLDVPFDYNSRARGDDSPWTIGLVLNFIYERKAKREAKQTIAEVEALNAYMQMEKQAFMLFAKLKKAYANYVITYNELQLINDELDVLWKLVDQLQLKVELGGGTEFEVSTIKLELQERFFKQQLMQNQLNEYRDQLLVFTQINQDELESIDIEKSEQLNFIQDFYTYIKEQDVKTLRSELLNTHADISLALNQYAISEAELKYKIEQQYPDVVLSPGFIFEQSDNLWALGVSWILPLFKNTQLNREIAIALEQRKTQQQQIIYQQKQLLDDFYLHYKNILRYKKSLDLSQSLLSSVADKSINLERQIELGGIDEVPLLRNKLALVQAKQNQLIVSKKAANEITELQSLFAGMLSSNQSINIKELIGEWVSSRKQREENAKHN